MKTLYIITVFLLCITTVVHSRIIEETANSQGVSYGLGPVRQTDMGWLLEEGYPKTATKDNPPFPINYGGTDGKSVFLYKLEHRDFKKSITFRVKFRIYPCQSERTLKDLGQDQKVRIMPNALSSPAAIISDLCGFSCIFTTYQNNNTNPIESKFWIWSQENIMSSLSRKKAGKGSRFNSSHSLSNIALYDTQDVKMTFDDKQNLLDFEINGQKIKYLYNDNLIFAPSFYYGFHARRNSGIKIEVSDVEIYVDEAGEKIETLTVTPYPQHEASHYEKLAKAGEPDAMYQMGMAYFDGRGVNKDYFEAVKWLRKAAEQGHVFAISMLGTCYYKGIGVEQSKKEAEKWFRTGADKFYGDAIFRLAFCRFETDMELKKPISTETLVILDTAMSKTNSNAMILRAEYEKMKGKNSEDESPLYFFAPAAMKKSNPVMGIHNINPSPSVKGLEGYIGGLFSYDSNPKGFYGFATTLLDKKNISKTELNTAITCLEQAAKLGFSPANEKLKSIQNKDYVSPDNKIKKEKAEKLFQNAKSQAELKTSEADKEAIRLFKEASELNHKQAYYELGVCYYKGLLGLKIDKKEAAKCWQKFEDIENQDNMENMIYMPLKAKYAFGCIMD